MIENLVIVGNGFDRWQGLDTSYKHFQTYYLAHRDEILKDLKIKPVIVSTKGRPDIKISPVELIYGSREDFGELDDEFWSTYENSLGQIEDEDINRFFGNSKSDLKWLKRTVRNCKRILQTAFNRWIATIDIDRRKPEYNFGDNTLFINFNYTDTLIKRMGVDPEYEYHIHGEATDPESIIVGHSEHPEYPEPVLKRIGGSFEGLYILEEMLYETDKHAMDNIQYMLPFLAMHGTIPEEIKNVYVLGHSFGKADLAYFAFLASCTTVKSESNEEIEIAPDKEAFIRQQEDRNRMIQKEAMRHLGLTEEDKKNYKPHAPRTSDAMWHVSYHTPEDKRRIEHVLDSLGCTNRRLCNSIDACIADFKI